MVDPSLILSGLSFLSGRQAAKQSQQAVDQLDNGGVPEEEMPAEVQENERVVQRQDKIITRLDRLYEVEAKNQPSGGDKDAFASATIDLGAGQTAEVTVEPSDGYNLRVRRIEFDRRDDHAYELNVGGDVTSVSHRAKYVSPKKVSQGDRVVATVTNNASSGTVVDFEMEAWAERP